MGSSPSSHSEETTQQNMGEMNLEELEAFQHEASLPAAHVQCWNTDVLLKTNEPNVKHC